MSFEIWRRRGVAVCAMAALGLVACETTSSGYGAATSADAQGYRDLQIEENRFRVSYRADTLEEASNYALLRAADVTLTNGYEWFTVVDATNELSGGAGDGGARPSISIGGSTGSYGSGVGVGIGFGLGGGGGRSSGDAVRTLEFIGGNGPKPEDANTYDANAVSASLRSGE